MSFEKLMYRELSIRLRHLGFKGRWPRFEKMHPTSSGVMVLQGHGLQGSYFSLCWGHAPPVNHIYEDWLLWYSSEHLPDGEQHQKYPRPKGDQPIWCEDWHTILVQPPSKLEVHYTNPEYLVVHNTSKHVDQSLRANSVFYPEQLGCDRSPELPARSIEKASDEIVEMVIGQTSPYWTEDNWWWTNPEASDNYYQIHMEAVYGDKRFDSFKDTDLRSLPWWQ